MRKIIRAAILAVVMFRLAFVPAYAQGTVFGGFAASVGIRENVRHAGVDNWSMALYYTEDGRVPTAADRNRGPAYFLESNTLEPAVTNHTPGDTTGKWWAVIAVKPLNAGEIKTVRTECAAVELPFSAELGGYLVDLSKLPPGKFFIGTSVTHEGGEVTYQVLIFLFRSKREVTDQAGFWLGVYDPDREYLPNEIAASPWFRSFEPANGAKAYALAFEGQKQMPIRIRQPLQADGSTPGMALVEIKLYQDQHLVSPGGDASLKLVAVDGSWESAPVKTQDGKASLYAPPGTYKVLITNPGQWLVRRGYSATNTISAENKTEIIIERREAR